MVLVRSLVVVALLLVLVGTAWLVVNRVRPHWLVDLHLPNSASPAVASTAQNSPRSTTGTTAAPSPSTPSMRLVSASGTEATFAVTSSSFDVQISASGGETWVQASGPLNSTPGWAGLLTDGQSQVVPATQKLVVQIGSIAARIAVRVDQRVIGTYVPPGAPFIMTFTTQ
jgi:cytoskeletal protein RodZ